MLDVDEDDGDDDDDEYDDEDAGDDELWTTRNRNKHNVQATALNKYEYCFTIFLLDNKNIVFLDIYICLSIS